MKFWQNKIVWLFLGFGLVMVLFFSHSLDSEASSNIGTASSRCDQKATSGGCTLLAWVPSSDIYQGWKGNIYAHIEGHGSWGGSGGVGAIDACLSRNGGMWESGSACWSIFPRTQVGDGRADVDTSRDIGGDPNPDFNFWTASLYANDATWDPIEISIEGRTVSIDSFNVPSRVMVNQSFTINWSTDYAEQNVELFCENVPGCSYDSGLSQNDSWSFTAPSTPGTGYITLKATGYGGSGGWRSIEVDRTITYEGTVPGGFTLYRPSCYNSGNLDRPGVSISWSSSSGATGYEVWERFWSTGSWNRIGSTTSTSYTTTIWADTDAYYFIRATNSVGSTDSNVDGVRCVGPPGSFSLSGISCAGATSPRVTISWSSSSNATRYRVERKVWSTGSWNQIASNLTSLSYTDNGPSPNAENYYRVYAGNSVTETLSSNTLSFFTSSVNCGGSAPTYTLSVSRTGSGSGTVTSSPGGINCGSTCAASYTEGTPVSLSVSPAAGSYFAGWSGDCSGTGGCSVTMNAGRSVTANFALGTYTLSVSKTGTGSGTVTSSPAGINCGSTCASGYSYGTAVTLTASPAAGSTFAGWSGDCSGTGGCNVTMNAARNVTANFGYVPPSPSCSYASPQTASTSASSGTFYAYAYGVLNVTSVLFATWSDAYGQDDLVWYTGANQGSGTWRADINLGSHQGIGAIYVHVYMYNASYSTVWCDDANFTRTAINDPINFYITYTANTGTLVVRSYDNLGNQFSSTYWDISGIGRRNGPSSTDSIPAGSYTITPASLANYTFTVSPNPASVTKGNTTTVTITYTPAPLNAPTNLTVNNSSCNRIALSWRDNATGESGYIVYRSTSPLPASPGSSYELVRLGADTTSYTDAPPAVNQTYYYKVRAYRVSPAAESGTTNEANALNRPCEANISNSTKILSYPEQPEQIRNGAPAIFLITISNSSIATAAADIKYLTEIYTTNLSNLRVNRVTGLSCVPDLARCISGNVVNVRGQVNPGTNATVEIQGDVTLGDEGVFETFKNTVGIYYSDLGGDGTIKNISRSVGPFLIRTRRAGVPNFREVAP